MWRSKEKSRVARGRRTAARRTADLRESAQLSLGDLISRLLPRGSRDERAERVASWRRDPDAWAKCPVWPPDLFAVAATLVQKSGSYAYFSQKSGRDRFGGDYPEKVAGLGLEWRRTLAPPVEVERWWSELLAYRDADINPADEDDEPLGRREKWWEHSLWLMAVADEAAVHLGFTVGESAEGRAEMRFADLVVAESATLLTKVQRRPELLKQLPASLCWIVPRSECCVLPKTRTPQVGMTLPRFSHNLALLPSAAEVQPRWILNPLDSELAPGQGAYRRLLLVPFPYRVRDEDFVARPGTGTFEVVQGWLGRGRASPRAFARFVTGLLREARREGGDVHGVVLPELALDGPYFDALRKALAAQPDVQLLITGFWGPRYDSRPGRLANQVRAVLFRGQHDLLPLSQAKHHRWKLDGGQIQRYLLADALDPATTWEERTAIDRRECLFFLGSTGTSVATLVCEDLARAEPVQTILRAVGPNLVVAILMDGPQLESRWSGKYATVLAEDPGCSVLTLTSQALVRRSVMPGKPERREVALWKEAGGQTQELELPAGSHALLLTLRLVWEESTTLDGRSDRGTSVKVSFAQARGVTHAAPPAWLDS